MYPDWSVSKALLPSMCQPIDIAFAAPSGETVFTDANRDFTTKQRKNGWSYGTFLGDSLTFSLAPSYTNAWTDGRYDWMDINIYDQHPAISGSTRVSAVRRWTSTYAGKLHVVGKFHCGADGDGTGVRVLVDGVVQGSRVIIGGPSAPADQAFDFVIAVQNGSTGDFSVDCRNGTAINFDATLCEATISSPHAAATPSTPPLRQPPRVSPP